MGHYGLSWYHAPNDEYDQLTKIIWESALSGSDTDSLTQIIFDCFLEDFTKSYLTKAECREIADKILALKNKEPHKSGCTYG